MDRHVSPLAPDSSLGRGGGGRGGPPPAPGAGYGRRAPGGGYNPHRSFERLDRKPAHTRTSGRPGGQHRTNSSQKRPRPHQGALSQEGRQHPGSSSGQWPRRWDTRPIWWAVRCGTCFCAAPTWIWTLSSRATPWPLPGVLWKKSPRRACAATKSSRPPSFCSMKGLSWWIWPPPAWSIIRPRPPCPLWN